jgi:MFS family permease
MQSFYLLVLTTVVAGYYSANGQLYRFAAAELAPSTEKEKAVSWVMAGGLIGAIVGPNLAMVTKSWLGQPFAGAYLSLSVMAIISFAIISRIEFPPLPEAVGKNQQGRELSIIMRQPIFVVAALGASLGYGVMSLLMSATPLAMQACSLSFEDTAFVLQWHVIGMFAPGFFTGHLIQRFGALAIMGAGVVINLVCIVIALNGLDVTHFVWALFLLGVGWNFLFTASTTLSLKAYTPIEKDRAQGAINFCVFTTMGFTAFASGAFVTTQGWHWLNWGSFVPVLITGAGLIWLKLQKTPT